MTEDELKLLLNNEDILLKLDIRSLVLDLLMKKENDKELINIFYDKLADLDAAYVKKFIYMQRDN